MSDLQLDPRVHRINTIAKSAGVMVVAAGAGVVIIAAGASLAVAGAVAIVGLAMVNFVVPVGARYIALQRQKALTALAEEFSEETIREDEKKENERIKLKEQKYMTLEAELQNSIEELSNQLKSADPENRELIQQQIQDIQSFLKEEQEDLQAKKVAFKKLEQNNALMITWHRSSKAMKDARGAERSAEEEERLKISRNAIKTELRREIAGNRIRKIDSALKDPNSGNVQNLFKDRQK